uniref:Uncharacterized protein n=2 Tax=Spongospora subterranea TaxID=70186 RepID=A0A0H5QXT6_9EUKA|eukprot:CRZ06562.1 hypothetical protein [Spongospora subterranea]
MSTFENPFQKVRDVKNMIDHCENEETLQFMFSVGDDPANVVRLGTLRMRMHLGQYFYSSSILLMFGVLQRSCSNLVRMRTHLNPCFQSCMGSFSTPSFKLLSNFPAQRVFPSDNAARVISQLQSVSDVETRAELLSLIGPRILNKLSLPKLLESGADVEALQNLFSRLYGNVLCHRDHTDVMIIFDSDLPPNVIGLVSNLVTSGGDAEALADLLSLFEHSSSNMRFLRMVIKYGAERTALEKLFQFLTDFSDDAMFISWLLKSGLNAGSFEARFYVLYNIVQSRHDHNHFLNIFNP